MSTVTDQLNNYSDNVVILHVVIILWLHYNLIWCHNIVLIDHLMYAEKSGHALHTAKINFSDHFLSGYYCIVLQ